MQVKGGTLLSHFEVQKLSEYDKTIHGYLRLIVLKSLPLYFISDPEIRRFSRFTAHVTKETLVEVLLKLVELVEKRIASEMDGTRGAVLFDGWTCNATHFIAVIASYCTPSITVADSLQRCTPRLTLLALSPMGQVPSDEADEDETDETAKFNAATYIQFFNEIFPFSGQDFSKWCVCLIGDNCSTNLKVAQLSHKKYVGCNSHKLNLEVNAMVDSHVQLRRTIESVHGTMRAARRLKNAALLRNLTDLSPIMHNATRWTGKLHMLRRFTRIRDELIEVQHAPDGDIAIDSSTALLSRTYRFVDILSEIDVVTKSLQTRGYTLAQCRDDLDILLEAVAEQRIQIDSPLYQCKLGQKYIAANAPIVLNPQFETGVVKLQKGRENNLTNEEREALACLKKDHNISNGEEESHSSAVGSSLGMMERLAKKRKLKCKPDTFINCDFILGSVAEVERLWSIAKHFLNDNRKSMTPQVFEAIIFLKMNARFWDAHLVSDAIHAARSGRVAAGLQQHLLQEE